MFAATKPEPPFDSFKKTCKLRKERYVTFNNFFESFKMIKIENPKYKKKFHAAYWVTNCYFFNFKLISSFENENFK